MKIQHARDMTIKKLEESTFLQEREKHVQALLPQVPDAIKYDGLNMLEWSEYVQLVLTKRGLEEHLATFIGLTDPDFKTWRRKMPRSVPGFLEAWPRIYSKCICSCNPPRLFGINFIKVFPNGIKIGEFTSLFAKQPLRRSFRDGLCH